MNRIERRHFLQSAGISAASLFWGGKEVSAQPNHQGRMYPRLSDIKDFEQIKSANKQVIVRLALSGIDSDIDLQARLKVQGAKLARMEHYFFEDGEDVFYPAQRSWKCRLTRNDFDVLVIWLDHASRDTVIEVEGNDEGFSSTLGELLAKEEIAKGFDGGRISANLLLDKEIGQIDPAQVNIKDTGDDFDFVIFADPQGGDPRDRTNDSTTRIKIHNPFVLKNVELVNKLNPQPSFLIIAGDIVDSQGQQSNYEVMLSYFKKLKVPVLFELGNHETPYGCRFGPGYNMEAMDNFFQAQKQMNGLDKLLYSFNAGKWHFVIWPDPLRTDFWQRHPHYFDWLDEDLKKHRDRPTMFFQHISLLPMGIDPLIHYSEKISVREKVLEILARYGNVRYAFSGHTHIPIKASMKNARSYRGMNFINLPATGYRSRAFGEADFEGGPSQGFTLVSVRGDQATVQYQQVTGKSYLYPDKLPEFRPDEWPLWLTEKWRLPANEKLINGDFEDGLRHWSRRFVYAEDNNPSWRCDASDRQKHSGTKSLYLFCRKRGAEVPGQDRMPQAINRLSQAVKLQKGTSPILKAWYRLDGKNYIAGNDNGACIWVEGYNGSSPQLDAVYWIGKAIFRPGGMQAPHRPYLHFDVTAAEDEWHEVCINLKKDYDRAFRRNKFDDLDIDRLTVTLGVWNLNVGDEKKIGVYFDDIEIRFDASDAALSSTIDGKPIGIKDENDIWRKVLSHKNGEHIFIPPKKRK